MTDSATVSEVYQMSTTARDKIDKWLKKFPTDKKASAIMQALSIVQEENGGWLSKSAMAEVAKYLDVTEIEVYEVATFYSMYELKPVGKHKISVCTNVSCMLCGCNKIVDHLRNKLEIDFGETTKDNKFTLKEVECLAACGGAPAMLIGKQYYENLTEEKVDAILASLE